MSDFKDTRSIGERILDEIAKQGMVKDAHYYPDSGYTFVWAANAEEQLTAFVDRLRPTPNADEHMLDWLEVLCSAFETLLELSAPHATKDNHANREKILADTKTLIANVKRRESVLDSYMAWPPERKEQLLKLGGLLMDLAMSNGTFKIEDLTRFVYLGEFLWKHEEDAPEPPLYEFLRRLAGFDPRQP